MSSIEYTTYDASTGRLRLRKTAHPSALEFEAEPYVLGIHDHSLFCVVDGRVVSRDPNPAVLIGMELHDVPLPSTIVIDHQRYEVYDNIVELNLPLPGTYSVLLESFPYQDATFTVVKP
jgi:hypothetical protein